MCTIYNSTSFVTYVMAENKHKKRKDVMMSETFLTNIFYIN